MVAGTVRLGSPIEPACVRVGRGRGVNCCYRDGKTEPVNVSTWVPLSPAALQETSGQTSLQRHTRTVILEDVEGNLKWLQSQLSMIKTVLKLLLAQ